MHAAVRITTWLVSGSALLFMTPEVAEAARYRSAYRSYSAPKQVRTYKPMPVAKAPARLAPKQPIPSAATRASTTRTVASSGPRSLGNQRRTVAVEKNTSVKTASGTLEKKVVTHPSGRRDVFTGATRKPNGSIGDPHGHTVLNKSRQVEYARTADGRVLKKSGTHIAKSDVPR